MSDIKENKKQFNVDGAKTDVQKTFSSQVTDKEYKRLIKSLYPIKWKK